MALNARVVKGSDWEAGKLGAHRAMEEGLYEKIEKLAQEVGRKKFSSTRAPHSLIVVL